MVVFSSRGRVWAWLKEGRGWETLETAPTFPSPLSLSLFLPFAAPSPPHEVNIYPILSSHPPYISLHTLLPLASTPISLRLISIPSLMGIWKPAWLEALDTHKFFVACSLHENAKKNEKNICCLDCCTSICPHCVPSHRFHRLVQVRRYVYHDVVRLEDLEKLIDCSNVQPYTINSSKVVFLKKRPQSRQFKGSGNTCTSCDRSLQEPYIHCSLGCKVDYILRQKKDLSPYLRTCETLQLSPDFFIPHDADDEVNETTHSTVMEGEEPMGSSDSENLSVPCTEFVRKKTSGLYACARSASSVSNEDVATNMSRRKGIPHRSPLC